ncbi:beta strand repeat-containing protein [Draconibacterium sp.]|uniref:beta strand repeat-containing protein n=1 Tax=Draconibacterium sp. TaxID=1965318 RepID=UPI00356B5F54
MKKLGFLFVFMALAGLTFAQNAVVDQTNESGTSVQAAVTQTGTNTATVTQSSVLNVNNVNTISATVNQTNTPGGVANSVTINQSITDDDDSDGSILSADATQEGEDNSIRQTQENNGNDFLDRFVSRVFTASQTGNSNLIEQSSTDGDQGSVEFTATQVGDENTATQTTLMAGGSSYNGDQTPFATGVILQEGNLNQATQIMQSLDAEGNIYQNGSSNIATQLFGNLTKENYADIDQIGLSNEAHQTFSPGNNTSVSSLTAYQNGEGNFSEQTVTVGNDNIGNVSQTGDYGDAFQTFTGNDNNATILQSGYENDATQNLTGDENTASIVQDGGEFNQATQEMSGMNDDASITQTASYSSVATQIFTSTSGDNTATILQNSLSGNTPPNTATQYVEGTSNNLSITQTGGSWYSDATQNVLGAESSNNTLTINQDWGDDNNALQSVTGSSNTVYGEQHGVWFGDGENLTQTITGDLNDISVIQYEDNAFATQTVTGDGNTLKTVQNGENASAVMLVIGDNNVAALEQNGSVASADIYQEGELNVVQGLSGAEFAIGNGTLDIDQFGTGNIANIGQTAFGASATVNQSGAGNVATVNQY